MIYYDVLNRREKEIWDLVMVLSDRKVVTSSKVLSKHLGITEFVLEQRIHTLDTAWRQLFDHSLFSGNIKENEDIYISDEQRLRFLNTMLDHSHGNLLLLDLFMDQFELADFIQKSGVSQAGVYRIRKEVQVALQAWGIRIVNSRLVGDEALIRNLFMSILNFRELDVLALADEELKKQVAEAVAVIREGYQLTLRPTQARLLSNLFFLSLVRYRSGHFHHKMVTINYTPRDLAVVAQLEGFIKIPREYRQGESDQLLLFLYGFGFMPALSFQYSEAVEKIHRFDHEFREKVMVIIDTDRLSQEQFDGMFDSCRRIHWRNMFFPNFFNGFDFMRNEDWAGLSDDLFETIDALYEKYQLLPRVFRELQQNYLSLFYDYFFEISSYLTDESLLPVVNVCVDFTQSTLMDDLMKRLLQVMWFCNFNVQDTVDETTDLYISDRRGVGVTVPQVIWADPPQYRELIQLSKLVTKIGQQKA